VPFVRFSRDRRGYEHTYLMHAGSRKGAPARILYWYRTPPGVKVGRTAFDPEVRRTLEAQYPSIEFDWDRIEATPMPPTPEAEPWRERRRAEKAAKTARASREAEAAEKANAVAAAEPDAGEAESVEPTDDDGVDLAAVPGRVGEAGHGASPEEAVQAGPADSPGGPAGRPSGTGRRRRGRRRRHGGGTQASSAPSGPSGSSD
jgi:hypothetical protein